jgi:hypothetical protein
MYELEWKPKAIVTEEKTIEPIFDGSIILKAPSYVERIKYFKDLNLLDKQVLDADTMVKGDRLVNMIEIAKKHIINVDLKRKDDGIEFKSVNDLEYDTDGGDILVQVCSYLLEGARLGKNLVKKSDGKPS